MRACVAVCVCCLLIQTCTRYRNVRLRTLTGERFYGVSAQRTLTLSPADKFDDHAAASFLWQVRPCTTQALSGSVTEHVDESSVVRHTDKFVLWNMGASVFLRLMTSESGGAVLGLEKEATVRGAAPCIFAILCPVARI